MAYTLRTIEDMEAIYYGNLNSPFLQKANSPMLTTTSGVYNKVFGAYAWANLNLEANGFGILPKYVWMRSGWRIITGKTVLTTTNGNTVLGGTGEGGLIAETAQPTIEQVSTAIKTAQLPFAVSETVEYLATESEDDVWGGLGALRLYHAIQHKEFLNRMILADRRQASRTAAGNFAGTTDYETLDCVVSSNAEKTAIQGGGFTGFFDPWAAAAANTPVDRDTATKYDSIVASASGTLATLGQLTDDTFRTWLRQIRKAGGKDPTVFLGSHEGYSEIQGIYTPAVRYNVLGEATVAIDVNGIQSFKGIGVGIHVDSIYGIPYIPTKDAPSDAGVASEVGRIFAFDTSDAEGFGYPRIGIMVARPTQYFEASKQTAGFPFLNANFTERGLYRTMAEVICRHFPSQGKLGDIQL